LLNIKSIVETIFSTKLYSKDKPMRLSDALPKKDSKKRRRRVGRGISAGQGASCGFGMRGQKSRSGRGTRPGFEGGQLPLYRRIPKLKHFTVINRQQYTTINIGDLASLPPNTDVTLSSLIEVGIVTTDNGPLKVLGGGELSSPLKVTAAAFTASAREKIDAAGGSCELLS
jgi:large subunit ribosomal protein L15